MLLQFNFRNFASFRDDTTLDLTAAKITEYNNHIVEQGNEKILPVAGIYGANASGKSNVIEAFNFMSMYVIASFNFGGENNTKSGEKESMKPTPFLMDSKSREADSMFEVYFVSDSNDNHKHYNYGFTLNHEGITEEWLSYKSKSSKGDFKLIFSRKGQNLELSGISAKSRENIKVALEKEALVVSLGAKLRIEKLKKIRDWFIRNEIADFGHPIENFFLSEKLPENFVDSEKVRNQVLDFFSTFDTSIIGFEVEEIKAESDQGGTKLRIDAVHKMIDSEETTKIPLKRESAGTLKMFALYPLLHNVLTQGSVLFVDELNSRLHPLLLRNILVTFINPETNPNHAQLVFTTHDAWILNANVLRRDEIWFTEKSDIGISTLYSLADFVDDDGTKIRKDENLEKNYLLGKYGAIPSLKLLDLNKEE